MPLCEGGYDTDGELLDKSTGVESLPLWIQSYMPRPAFGMEYSWEYAKALVKFLIETPFDPTNISLLRSLPDCHISDLINEFYTLVYIVTQGRAVTETQIRPVKSRLSNVMRSITKEQMHNPDSKYILAFCLEILFLLLSIQDYTAECSQKERVIEARCYLSYYLANGLYLADPDSADGLPYARQGIALSDSRDRQDAFNILGLCALRHRGKKQLAYDTYLSWIKKEPIGLLGELWPKNFVFGSGEDVWREAKENADSVATMYNNYAYVCDAIARTYEIRSPERKRFQKIAKDSIAMAIEKHAYPSYYHTYGLILADMNTPDRSSRDSLLQYEMALRSSKALRNRLLSMSLYCDAMIDDLLAMLINSKQDFCSWAGQAGLEYFDELNRRFQAYKQMLKAAQKDSNIADEDKHNYWKNFFGVQYELKGSNARALELSLLLISQLSANLKKFLRRNAYSTINYYTRDWRKDAKVNENRDSGRAIAYYTTIKTAMYLFDVLYRPQRGIAPAPVAPGDDGYEEGINCLTMMQAYYMNDPYEGLAFEKGISGDDPNKNVLFYRGNAWRFREDIFQKNFVFLKSFTDRMDNLLMWNRYGSDREIGSRDSNGCCIRFDPRFFERVNDTETVDTRGKLLVDKDDDYRLYRVVYLNQQGEIENAKNPKLDHNVKRCYGLMRQLLQYVNSVLCEFSERNPNDKRIEKVRSFVQEALNPIIFLFKDDEYADEQEYRLVVSRSYEELDNIRTISSNPNKVCINPYFQVCIDKVILGPNVEKPEHWFNHFRYQIAAMWRRSLDLGEAIPEFTVEKSAIHYHT